MSGWFVLAGYVGLVLVFGWPGLLAGVAHALVLAYCVRRP